MPRIKTLLIAASLAFLARPLGALGSDLESSGPYATGYRVLSQAGTTRTHFEPSPTAAANAVFAMPPSAPNWPFVGDVHANSYLTGRVYYPATGAPVDPAAAIENATVHSPPEDEKWPVIAFMHGFGAMPLDYDTLLSHVASHGFIVVAGYHLFSEGEWNQSSVQQALDMSVLLNQFVEWSQNPTNWIKWCHPTATFVLRCESEEWVEEPNPFHGMIDPSPNATFGAFGHSMGSIACLYLLGLDSRVRAAMSISCPDPTLLTAGDQIGTAVVPATLYDGVEWAIPDVQTYRGSLATVVGDEDVSWISGNPYFWHDTAAATNPLPTRNLAFTIAGAGHFAPFTPAAASLFSGGLGLVPTSLAASEQFRLTRRIVTGYFRAELLADHHRYFDLLGPGIVPEPVLVKADCSVPAVWAAWGAPPLAPNEATVGVAGRAGHLEGLFSSWHLTGGSVDPLDDPLWENGAMLHSFSVIPTSPDSAGNPTGAFPRVGVVDVTQVAGPAPAVPLGITFQWQAAVTLGTPLAPLYKSPIVWQDI